jgi:hypothetical protein
MSTPRSLKTRLILRSLFAVIFVAVFLFVPAGSLRYWQGWVFMAIWFLPHADHFGLLPEARPRTRGAPLANTGKDQ